MNGTVMRIDCDAPATIPVGCEDWGVKKHAPGGQITWDPSKIRLRASERRDRRTIPGVEFVEEVGRPESLNANVLGFLRENLRLTPPVWKGLYVFFPNTQFETPKGKVVVLCIDYSGETPRLGFHRLDMEFDTRRSRVAEYVH